MAAFEPLIAGPSEEIRPPLEEIRSHLTVVLNDLALVRWRMGPENLDRLRPLIDEALAYAERLSEMTRATSYRLR